MAKGRMLNRTIATDARFNSLTKDEQWLFMRMLPFADDEGKLPGNLIELKLMTVPGENIKEATIEKLLKGMERSGLVRLAIGTTIQYKGWSKNQKLGHRPATSLYPDIVEDTEKGQERSAKVATTELNITKDNITKINISFDDFWDLYDKKIGKPKSEVLWNRLTDEERTLIIKYIPKYKISKEKQYRKDPERFIAHRVWEDEIIITAKDVKPEPKKIDHFIYRCPVCQKEWKHREKSNGAFQHECDCDKIEHANGSLHGHVLKYVKPIFKN